MSQGIGPGVEIVVVLRFIDSYAPENDRRMVAIATDHPAHVVDGKLLPGFVPNMLPARNLFQDEKTDFIAVVERMPRLWVVRGTDDVAFELVAQDLCIAALDAARHRLTDQWESLMAIKAA